MEGDPFLNTVVAVIILLLLLLQSFVVVVAVFAAVFVASAPFLAAMLDQGVRSLWMSLLQFLILLLRLEL